MSDLRDIGRNADQIIWRAWEGDYYADSIHVTHEGAIGISCGGTAYVMPVRDWHKLAALRAALAPQVDGETLNFRFSKNDHGPLLTFVEAENADGYSVHVGEWSDDGQYRVLTIPNPYALRAHVDRLSAELAAERERRVKVEGALKLGKIVMDLLQKHGPSIVPHLLDTDENAGQRFRDALERAATLTKD